MQAGLTNLKYGVDEGRVLDGPDGKVLIAREAEHPIQAAGDAKLFHLMVDHDVDYFSTWGVTTDELFGDVPIVGANLRNLAFRMNGSALLKSQRSGRPGGGDDVSRPGGLRRRDEDPPRAALQLQPESRRRVQRGVGHLNRPRSPRRRSRDSSLLAAGRRPRQLVEGVASRCRRPQDAAGGL